MTNRYGIDAGRLKGQKDIVEYIRDLRGRMADKETSLQIGNTAIEDGSLTVRNGDIIVSESDGHVVLRVLHGEIPEIRFFPIGESSDTHRGAIFSYDASGNPLDPNQVLALDIEELDSDVDGGKIELTKKDAFIGHVPNGLGQTWIWFNPFGDTTQLMAFNGRLSNQFQYSNEDAIYTGSEAVSAGFSSYTHTYFTSFATTVAPVVGLVNTGGAISWVISAMSTSSFTVAWSGTTAKTVNWWNFRL